MEQALKDISTAATQIDLSLTGGAARKAIEYLMGHWTHANRQRESDFGLAAVGHDIDEVIDHLTKLRIGASEDPMATRKMRLALELKVEFPAWDTLTDEARAEWTEWYRVWSDTGENDPELVEDAKYWYRKYKGIKQLAEDGKITAKS